METNLVLSCPILTLHYRLVEGYHHGSRLAWPEEVFAMSETEIVKSRDQQLTFLARVNRTLLHDPLEQGGCVWQPPDAYSILGISSGVGQQSILHGTAYQIQSYLLLWTI